jgi:sulfur carrier protein
MNILVNGKPRKVAATTLADVVAELGYAGARVATAHAGEFVPSQSRPECQIRDGEKVEILGPMQGG